MDIAVVIKPDDGFVVARRLEVPVLALRGEVLLEVAGKNILVTPAGGTDSKSNPNEEPNR